MAAIVNLSLLFFRLHIRSLLEFLFLSRLGWYVVTVALFMGLHTYHQRAGNSRLAHSLSTDQIASNIDVHTPEMIWCHNTINVKTVKIVLSGGALS